MIATHPVSEMVEFVRLMFWLLAFVFIGSTVQVRKRGTASSWIMLLIIAALMVWSARLVSPL